MAVVQATLPPTTTVCNVYECRLFGPAALKGTSWREHWIESPEPTALLSVTPVAPPGLRFPFGRAAPLGFPRTCESPMSVEWSQTHGRDAVRAGPLPFLLMCPWLGVCPSCGLVSVCVVCGRHDVTGARPSDVWAGTLPRASRSSVRFILGILLRFLLPQGRGQKSGGRSTSPPLLSRPLLTLPSGP